MEHDRIGQISAFFADKNDGIDIFKLMKLLYIANRQCLFCYAHPMFFDTMSSASSGVVLHNTRSRIINADFYDKYIRFDANLIVHTLKDCTILNRPTVEDFDELSEASVEILEKVWEDHGHQTDLELRDYMECLYHEINKNKEITFLDILKAVGNLDPEYHYNEILYFRDLDEMFRKYENDAIIKE